MRATHRIIRSAMLRVEKWVTRNWVDSVISVGHGAAEELGPVGVPSRVIPGGVDCAHWRPDEALRCEARAKLGYGDEHLVIGYLSRLVRSKGGASFLKAAARVLHAQPRARFLMVGDGPARAELEEQAAALGLNSCLQMVGFQPWWDTPAYFNAMDVYVFPSFTEACGLSLLEAMACGVPSVARRNAGSLETIVPGTGTLVTTDDELTLAIVQLGQDEELRRRLGMAARESVRRRFSWETIAAQTADVYYEAIARHERR